MNSGNPDPKLLIKEKAESFDMQGQHYCKVYVQASKDLREKLKRFVYAEGTAKAFARANNIGYDVLLDYLKGEHAIPLKYIEQLAKATEEELWSILKGEFIRPQGTKNFFRVPGQLTPMEANLLGWILSEGHLAKNTLQISQKNKKVLVRIKFLLQQFFYLKSMTIVRDRNGWKLLVYNSAFRNYLNLRYRIPVGKKSYFIEVPEQIYSCKEETIAAFLAGCLEGDGDFSFYIRTNSRGCYKAPRISLNSASFAFMIGVKKLLEQMGISSKIYSYGKPNNRSCHKLSVFRATDCMKLISQILPFMLHPNRIESVNKILSNRELLNMIRISNKGYLFKRLKYEKSLGFDEIARTVSEHYNYKVVKDTVHNWACNQFAPPLSAIVFACEVLGEDIQNHIPPYLSSLLSE